MPKNNYENGRRAEQRVARILRQKGASVQVSPGSRGSADLKAQFPRKTWLVQVKSGVAPAKSLKGTDQQRLNQTATKRGATPVLATVTESGVEFRSTRCNRRLKP